MAILAQGCKSAAVEETGVSSSPPAQFPLSNCAQCVAITGLGVKGCTAAEPLVPFFSSSNVLKLEVTKDLSWAWRANAWIDGGAYANPKVGLKHGTTDGSL